MPLPLSLEKLPPEVVRVLRYMGTQSGALTPQQIDLGTNLGARLVGKAIRRLVNYDFIQIGANNSYHVTTDGKSVIQQLDEHEGGTPDDQFTGASFDGPVQRRLTVVMPRVFAAGRPTDIYFGVNPPDTDVRLPGSMHIELKVSANAGNLSSGSISLEVPGNSAAKPGKISLMPQVAGKVVRVRVDAFQTTKTYAAEALGGIYFDVQVAAEGAGQDATSRAVGMDLLLKLAD